ncbi:MAG: glycosyltransferase 87 family protein [Candidatus Hodarchaeota archaeon]
MNIDNNDYLSFHNAGSIVIEDLPNLYNSDLYLFPFRYFPLSAYFFTPFSLLGLKMGYFVFQIFNFLLNFINIYLIFKIVQIYKNLNPDSDLSYELDDLRNVYNKSENESLLHQNAIYLIMLPQFMNYFLGQINILVSFFILASLFYFLKGGNRNDFIGGLLLGFGILIKPTLILIIPFLIPLQYIKERKKYSIPLNQTILRLVGPIILIAISGLFFLVFPEMLADFIEVNLAGRYTYNIGGDLEINPSFSLTRNVLILCEVLGLNFNNFIVFIFITFLFLLPIYLLFTFVEFVDSTNQPKRLINGFLIGNIIMLIVYFDSWPHHLVVLAPFLIMFILLNKHFKHITLIKYTHYLLATIIIGFWGLFYLTYEFFPFNIGGLILLIFLYSAVFIYYRNKLK